MTLSGAAMAEAEVDAGDLVGHWWMILLVKNRFSNPTKVQIGRDQYRKDKMIIRRRLSKRPHERE